MTIPVSDSSLFSPLPSNSAFMTVALATGTVFLGYRLLQHSNLQARIATIGRFFCEFVQNKAPEITNYFNDFVTDQASDALILVLSPNVVLSDGQLRDKARLIQIRKRVLSKLIDQIEQDRKLKENRLLSLFAASANHMCKALDCIRPINPYEPLYAYPSLVEQIQERVLLNSVILKFKPDAECTKEELDRKKTKYRRLFQVVVKAWKKFPPHASLCLQRTQSKMQNWFYKQN
jgi:hypothetical protein